MWARTSSIDTGSPRAVPISTMRESVPLGSWRAWRNRAWVNTSSALILLYRRAALPGDGSPEDGDEEGLTAIVRGQRRGR
jgi:hypothetical protein